MSDTTVSIMEKFQPIVDLLEQWTKLNIVHSRKNGVVGRDFNEIESATKGNIQKRYGAIRSVHGTVYVQVRRNSEVRLRRALIITAGKGDANPFYIRTFLVVDRSLVG